MKDISFYEIKEKCNIKMVDLFPWGNIIPKRLKLDFSQKVQEKTKQMTKGITGENNDSTTQETIHALGINEGGRAHGISKISTFESRGTQRPTGM